MENTAIMKPCPIRSLHSWFGRYTRQYRNITREARYPVDLKVIHCQRVRKEMVALGKALNLDERSLCVAEAAGLLHDIGRFEQYRQYRTFVDSISINHAECGLEVLKKHHVLRILTEKEAERIEKAILYHNRAGLPDKESEEVILLARMLRDADKLDIWRVFIAHQRLAKEGRDETVDLGLPDTPAISEAALADLLAQRVVDIKHVQNRNDFALLRLGWVFDVNFSHTLQEITRRAYLPMLKKSLPKDERTAAAFLIVQTYINQRCCPGGHGPTCRKY